MVSVVLHAWIRVAYVLRVRVVRVPSSPPTAVAAASTTTIVVCVVVGHGDVTGLWWGGGSEAGGGGSEAGGGCSEAGGGGSEVGGGGSEVGGGTSPSANCSLMYCEETLRQLLVIRVITNANTTRIMMIATSQSQMPGTPLDEVRAREVTILYVCIQLFSNNFGTL